MIALVTSVTLLAGSFCLMAYAIVQNQLFPSYESALAIPFVNLASIVIALLGMTIAIFAYNRNKDSLVAKRIMVLGIICAVLLVVMFPFSNLGTLSRIR